MPTIKDVAKRAGVSPATVSYVLNQTRFVSPATEARVRQAIRELNYQPNHIARSLRARRTMTVGMIMSDITNPFFADIVRGAEDVLSEKHYSLILCNTDEAPERELATLQLLRQKKVDGLIVVATGHNVAPLYEVNALGLPVVLVDRQLPGDQLDTVVVDNQAGAYQATRHLLELGHRRIGLIIGLQGISTTMQRRRGYELALQDYGLAPDPTLIQEGHSTIEGGAAAAETLLDLNPPPTALFATNNLMTIGVFLTIKQRRLRCPQDIAVVGFDDMVWLSVFTPGVTTVVQPSYEIGQRAAHLLLDRMTGKSPHTPRVIMLAPQLIIRESCGYRHTL
jgi:DNA-binding LacI/PurR family transcriptional regulator